MSKRKGIVKNTALHYRAKEKDAKERNKIIEGKKSKEKLCFIEKNELLR